MLGARSDGSRSPVRRGRFDAFSSVEPFTPPPFGAGNRAATGTSCRTPTRRCGPAQTTRRTRHTRAAHARRVGSSSPPCPGCARATTATPGCGTAGTTTKGPFFVLFAAGKAAKGCVSRQFRHSFTPSRPHATLPAAPKSAAESQSFSRLLFARFFRGELGEGDRSGRRL